MRDRPTARSRRSTSTNATTRAQVEQQSRLFIEHGTYFDATMSAYGYWTVREPALYDDWADERAFLTPFARRAVEAQLPRAPLAQFEKIHYVKKCDGEGVLRRRRR